MIVNEFDTMCFDGVYTCVLGNCSQLSFVEWNVRIVQEIQLAYRNPLLNFYDHNDTVWTLEFWF